MMRVVAAIAFCVCAPLSVAQVAVPPPPKPPDSGPSLAVTMQFIQDKLGEIGRVNYIAPYQDITSGQSGSNTFNWEFSQISADPAQCTINYHEKLTRDGKVSYDSNYRLPLKEAQDVVVEPKEQQLNSLNAANGHPNFVASPTTPPLVVLIVRRPHNEHTIDAFPFVDASIADRVAKAFTHAIELCGGGNKDPF